MQHTISSNQSLFVLPHRAVVYSADNGGYLGNGGNSTPYRGGKFSDFDGGTRVPAWISGGLVPAAMRGTTLDTLVHIADWVR